MKKRLVAIVIILMLVILSMPLNGSSMVFAADDIEPFEQTGVPKDIGEYEGEPDFEIDVSNVTSKYDSLSEEEEKLSTKILQLIDSNYLDSGRTTDDVISEMQMQKQITEGYITEGTDERGSGPEVYVYIKLNEDGNLSSIEPYVSRIENQDEQYDLAAAWVNVDNIINLASLDDVRGIREVTPPVINTGSVLSQGDPVLQADDVRAQFGVDGTGIKIGIISDGVDNYRSAVSSGDLPASLTVLRNIYGGDEGTAMLEIVHDLAPGAQLYFHDAGDNVLAFNEAIDDLVEAGCDIICDDVSWVTEPFFEDGTVADHVQSVLDATDVIYVSSAGNSATSHYQGVFYNDGYGFNDFSNGTSSYKNLYAFVPAGGAVQVVMQWDEAFGSASSNYDIYLLNAADGSYITGSHDVQEGNEDPFERCIYINDTGTDLNVIIAAHAVNAPVDKTLELYIYSYGGGNYSDNIVIRDSIFSQAALPDVVTCGAMYVAGGIEEFSGRGPVTMRTETRQKPDICGVDGVFVTGAGGLDTRFYGTSAAAPHVAAIAALLESRFPSMSPSEIRQLMYDTADDYWTTGHDVAYGYGRVNAYRAAWSYMKVNFNCLGGSAVAAQLVANGGKITEPEKPTKQGFALVGWYKEEQCINEWRFDKHTVTQDTTLYAKWGVPCDVTFNSVGGTTVDSQIVGEEGRITEPQEPTKSGYVLLGWFTEAACTNRWDFFVNTVTEDMTLYALWGEMLDGSGTAEDPYLIDNELDLLLCANMVNEANPEFLNKYYLQTADIDLSQFKNWTPIGWATDFYGNYDGAGYTISNLNIDINIESLDSYNTSPYGVGLFGRVRGQIINTNLVGGTINTQGDIRTVYIGGIAGIFASGYIGNCSSSVDISGYGSNVGGIVGYMGEGTHVRYCDNSGTIAVDGYGVAMGGIAGYAYGARITDCLNTGTISVSSDDIYNLYMGGIAGKLDKTDLLRCENSGSIIVLGQQANARDIGGIAGILEQGTSTLTDCGNSGFITCYYSRSTVSGGLIGYISDSSAEITRCYNKGNIYIQSGDYIRTGGTIGSISSLSYSCSITECYNEGDISIENLGSKRTSIGGLLSYDYSKHSEISDCYNCGNIVCPDYSNQEELPYIGGILGFGHNSNSAYTNCYNIGEISETGNFGGIIGKTDADPDSVFFNCYYADTCSQGIGYAELGDGSDVGSRQTISELKQQATYSGFDFTDTWEIIENEGFPELQNVPYVYVTGISLPEFLALDIGSSATLTPVFEPADAANREVTWSTSDESIATVSADGEVTLLVDGTATITVTSVDGGYTDTCEVFKRIPVTEISLDITTLELEQGVSAVLTPTVLPAEATYKEITWSSSDEDIAIVVGGKVKGIRVGTATITATNEDSGLAATCEVTVTESPMDVNDDGIVDMLDLVTVSQKYKSSLGDGVYDVICDLNDDGIINLFDLIMVGKLL